LALPRAFPAQNPDSGAPFSKAWARRSPLYLRVARGTDDLPGTLGSLQICPMIRCTVPSGDSWRHCLCPISVQRLPAPKGVRCPAPNGACQRTAPHSAATAVLHATATLLCKSAAALYGAAGAHAPGSALAPALQGAICSVTPKSAHTSRCTPAHPTPPVPNGAAYLLAAPSTPLHLTSYNLTFQHVT
jgi:hypothetical protein